jgi:O-antigen/teichoic acid export membrane protein
VAITLTGTVLSQLDKVVLSSALTLGSFAVYSVASMVSGAVRLLAQPIDLAVYPRLTQLYQTDDQAGLSELYHRATQYSVVVMGGLAVFLFAFGPEVLQMWTQNIELSARVSPVLRILVIGMLLNGLMNGPYYLQMAAGWTDLLVRTNVVMVVIFVPVVIASVLMFGLIGAATAWVLINIAYLAFVTRVMHRRLLRGEMLTWYGRDILEPVAGAAVAGVLLRLLMPIQTGLLAGYLTLALIGILAFSGLAAGRVRQDLVGVVHRRFSEAQASDRRM